MKKPHELREMAERAKRSKQAAANAKASEAARKLREQAEAAFAEDLPAIERDVENTAAKGYFACRVEHPRLWNDDLIKTYYSVVKFHFEKLGFRVEVGYEPESHEGPSIHTCMIRWDERNGGSYGFI